MRRVAAAPCAASRIARKRYRSSSGSAPEEGFTDERARASAHKFRVAFDELDQRLAQHPYLMGDSLSVLDIAWFIYAHRLSLGGYPFAQLHPRVAMWMESFALHLGLQRKSQCRQPR